MNTRSVFVSLIAVFAVAFTAPLATAADPAPAPQKHEETELGKAMGSLNSAWRKLRRQAADTASNASSLELVATIKAAALKSAELAPDLAKDKPESERPKFIAAYQAKMKEFIAGVEKLEAALKAGDNAAAGELIKELGSMQRDGHKEYRRPESK